MTPQQRSVKISTLLEGDRMAFSRLLSAIGQAAAGDTVWLLGDDADEPICAIIPAGKALEEPQVQAAIPDGRSDRYHQIWGQSLPPMQGGAFHAPRKLADLPWPHDVHECTDACPPEVRQEAARRATAEQLGNSPRRRPLGPEVRKAFRPRVVREGRDAWPEVPRYDEREGARLWYRDDDDGYRLPRTDDVQRRREDPAWLPPGESEAWLTPEQENELGLAFSDGAPVMPS